MYVCTWIVLFSHFHINSLGICSSNEQEVAGKVRRQRRKERCRAYQYVVHDVEDKKGGREERREMDEKRQEKHTQTHVYGACLLSLVVMPSFLQRRLPSFPSPSFSSLPFPSFPFALAFTFLSYRHMHLLFSCFPPSLPSSILSPSLPPFGDKTHSQNGVVTPKDGGREGGRGNTFLSFFCLADLVQKQNI